MSNPPLGVKPITLSRFTGHPAPIWGDGVEGKYYCLSVCRLCWWALLVCFTRAALLASFKCCILHNSWAHQAIRVSSPTRPWLHILCEVIKHAAKKGKNSPKGTKRLRLLNEMQRSYLWFMKEFNAIKFLETGKQQGGAWAGIWDRTENYFHFPFIYGAGKLHTRCWQISHSVGFPNSLHGHLMPPVPLQPWMSNCEKYKREPFYLLSLWSVLNTWQKKYSTLKVASIWHILGNSSTQKKWWEST